MTIQGNSSTGMELKYLSNLVLKQLLIVVCNFGNQIVLLEVVFNKNIVHFSFSCEIVANIMSLCFFTTF